MDKTPKTTQKTTCLRCMTRQIKKAQKNVWKKILYLCCFTKALENNSLHELQVENLS